MDGPRRAARADGVRRETTIHVRAPARTRDLIDKAASSLGKTRSEFILESARSRAVDVLIDERLFGLDDSRHAAFLDALDTPPAAHPRLVALMRRRPAWEA
ncbi:type II toxin-antitoxin system TacA family antitoxin [Salinarimonas ramus]|uniref:DUF1778 domain-containing protein n=1 Tax=Salinarimonas ramus TaxID=690164 RepID=A0A917Q5P0_9HYPH|nr:DUF1778 domain-containing protein [Salinarimonas ramus]GGK26933.1 hypothetical protein GCM10011322_11770 [Salinarimonas ramus]